MSMAATVVPFPSVRPDPMANVRALVYQQVNAWLESLAPLFEQGAPPTLRELSARFTATRGQLLGGCMKAFAEELHAHFCQQRQMNCPKCGKTLKRKRLDRRRITTLQGPLELERPYFYCSDCRSGYHPLDHALELAEGVHQYDIQEKLLRHGAEVPYATAAELVGDLIGLTLSNHFGHDTAVDVSSLADLDTVVPDAAEIRKRIEDAKTGPDDKPVLVVALDGAHEPTRPKAGRAEKRGPGQWKEAKGVRCYLALPDDRIVQLASWHQIQDAEAMRHDLACIAQRIPQAEVRIALLGDGAAWVWNSLTEAFPTGRPILDYYHCKQHLYAVADAYYEDTPQGVHWVEATLARLAEDRVSHVIAGLRRMEPATAKAQEAIDRLITYLENQQDRFGYDACKAEGMPIGSGGIESANKFIGHVRLKRSGAWWVVENGNGMLRLRCALYNGTFQRVFDKYDRALLGHPGAALERRQAEQRRDHVGLGQEYDLERVRPKVMRRPHLSRYLLDLVLPVVFPPAVGAV